MRTLNHGTGVAAATIALAGLLAAGCDAPTATITGVNFSDLTLEGATMNFEVAVANHYAVPLPLTNVGYGLTSSGQQFLTGQANTQGEVPARGSKTLTIPVSLHFNQLMQVLSGVHLGQLVPYTAKFDFAADVPAIGHVDFPIQKDGQFPIPNVPVVALKGANFGLSMNPIGVTGDLQFGVTNTNDFAATLAAFNYALKVGGDSVASGNLGQPMTIQPHQEGTVGVHTSFALPSLSAAQNVVSNPTSAVKASGDLKFQTAFGDMDLPFSSR